MQISQHVCRWFAVLVLACSLIPAPAIAAQTIRVITTTTDLAYFAREVGGNHVKVEALARPSEDVHHVQVKPSLLSKLNQADLFAMVGLDLEGWVVPLLKKTSSAQIRPGAAGYVVASLGCQILEKPQGKVDRSMGDIHPGGNPHLWLSARNAKQCATNILAGLVRVDPTHEADYLANFGRLATSIDVAAAQARGLLETVTNRQVVQQHSTFSYLFSEIGVTTYGFIEPRPGIESGAQHLAQLKAGMRAAGIRAVTTEPSLNQKSAKSIAGATGAQLVVLGQHVGSLPNTDSWEALILEDARRLAAALTGG